MKYIKYFFHFLIIIFLFLIFKVIGYRNASNLGASIGKKFGKIIKSDKVILKNLSIIQEFLKEEIRKENNISEKVFSKYGRILSEYVYLKNFRNGQLKNYITVQGSEILDEIKKKTKMWFLYLDILIILNLWLCL